MGKVLRYLCLLIWQILTPTKSGKVFPHLKHFPIRRNFCCAGLCGWCLWHPPFVDTALRGIHSSFFSGLSLVVAEASWICSKVNAGKSSPKRFTIINATSVLNSQVISKIKYFKTPESNEKFPREISKSLSRRNSENRHSIDEKVSEKAKGLEDYSTRNFQKENQADSRSSE